MSSSDSSDNDSAKLLASIDPDFQVTNGTLSAMEEGDETTKSNKPACPLGEKDPKHAFKSRPLYSLEVTPESQQFIAKHLSLALDRQIKETHSKRLSKLQRPDMDQDGIYLFSTSTSQICKRDMDDKPPKNRMKLEIKRRKIEPSDSDDEDIRLKSVVVSSDWVLNSNTI